MPGFGIRTILHGGMRLLVFFRVVERFLRDTATARLVFSKLRICAYESPALPGVLRKRLGFFR